jgi:hypothetical protein
LLGESSQENSCNDAGVKPISLWANHRRKEHVMGKKCTMLGVLSMVIVLKFATEASAGCIPLGGGGLYCAAWLTGSEVCATLTTGLGHIEDCMPGKNCPVVTCSVFGTVDTGRGCNPKKLDSRCGIKGLAFFKQSECNQWYGENRDCPGKPFILKSVLSEQKNITLDTTCNEKGAFLTTIELEPEDKNFITFTAQEFNAEACICPGGFSHTKPYQCCADGDRSPYGGCVRKGEEVCVRERCTANLQGYRPGQSIPYQCPPLSQKAEKDDDDDEDD